MNNTSQPPHRDSHVLLPLVAPTPSPNDSFVLMHSPAPTPPPSSAKKKHLAPPSSLKKRKLVRCTSRLYDLDQANANAQILRANMPPDYSNASLQDIMKQIKAKNYYNKQFQNIQAQTGINKNTLFFTNVEPTFYERNYLDTTQATSVFRAKVCCAIGCSSLFVLYSSEQYRGLWKPGGNGRTESDTFAIQVLCFGVICPSFLLGLLLTFTRFGKKHLENMMACIFVVVAGCMLAKKPIEKASGPIIPLLILLVPIFGITRMRYLKSCVIGWSIFVSYFVVMMVALNVLPDDIKFDNASNISYQTINYGISVIGGMISQYRQELLRRRNFCLSLPFAGTIDDEVRQELASKPFERYKLMHRYTQKFRNPKVEETFYRFWYLIDPFPYENPNSGSLHAGVFRTIRFAIMTLFLNQVVLTLQDIKFLVISKTDGVPPHAFVYTAILRLGVTVPLYFAAGLFMLFVGQAFYERWVREAEEEQQLALGQNEAFASPAANAAKARASLHKTNSVDNNHAAIDVVDDPGRTTPRMEDVADAAMIREQTRGRVNDLMEILTSRGGYVRSAQLFSSLVIATHVACMGAILLIVSKNKPKPVYYMGFLNAVLFAHRSGFRVRFVFATHTTAVVAIAVIVAAYFRAHAYYLEYAGYVVVIFLLGMMISYDEESVRRSFFVLKSIRTLEFEEWFSVVLRVQGWVKQKLQKRLEQVRSNKKTLQEQEKVDPKRVVVNTSAQMAQASQLGMYSQMLNIGIAMADVLQTLLQ